MFKDCLHTHYTISTIRLIYSKTCLKQPLLYRPKIVLKDQLSLNADQKYCRMLPLEHSAILLTCIKQRFVIKIFVLSIFERLLKTGFTVIQFHLRGPLRKCHKAAELAVQLGENGMYILFMGQHTRFQYLAH